MAANLTGRSALSRRHAQQGATMAVHHGWQVAARFGRPEEEARQVREGVGLADVSWIGKIEAKDLDDVPGPPASPGRATWRLARGHWLVTCGAGDRGEAARALAARHSCVRVTDMSSVHAAFLLAGPKGRELLGRLTSLDVSDQALPDRACAQAGVAQVHAIVLRQDVGGLPAYRLLVEREVGEYFWEATMHAGREFGIVPFGLEAMELLERAPVAEGRP